MYSGGATVGVCGGEYVGFGIGEFEKIYWSGMLKLFTAIDVRLTGALIGFELC